MKTLLLALLCFFGIIATAISQDIEPEPLKVQYRVNGTLDSAILSKSLIPQTSFARLGQWGGGYKIIKSMNMTGVQNEFVNAGIFEYQFDTSILPVGMYFIKITQRDFTKTLKLVKEG